MATTYIPHCDDCRLYEDQKDETNASTGFGFCRFYSEIVLATDGCPSFEWRETDK